MTGLSIGVGGAATDVSFEVVDTLTNLSIGGRLKNKRLIIK